MGDILTLSAMVLEQLENRERDVLGSMIYDAADCPNSPRIKSVLDAGGAELFRQGKDPMTDHRKIAQTVFRMYAAGTPVNVLTVSEELSGQIQNGYVIELDRAGEVVALSRFEWSLNKLIELSTRQALQTGLLASLSLFSDVTQSTESIIADLTARLDKARAHQQSTKQKYVCVDIGQFIQHQFPPREPLLEPILYGQTTGMIFAARGMGKTYFGLSIAYAVATGGTVFGRWHAPQPSRVLYIDGEMSGLSMQERLMQIAETADKDLTDPTMLKIFTPDLQSDAMPNLATKAGQQAIEPFLDGVKLVIVDNLSCLCPVQHSNDEDSWRPIQSWVLDLRRRGFCVLLLHHAGKNGQQRGTSAKEDVINLSIELRRPADYSTQEGLRIEVHFSKARDLYGANAEPFEASLVTDENGRMVWATRSLADAEKSQVHELLSAGTSETEIAQTLNISRAKVHKFRQILESEGKSFAKSRGGAGTHRRNR